MIPAAVVRATVPLPINRSSDHFLIAEHAQNDQPQAVIDAEDHQRQGEVVPEGNRHHRRYHCPVLGSRAHPTRMHEHVPLGKAG